jgi:hypothetical protein
LAAFGSVLAPPSPSGDTVRQSAAGPLTPPASSGELRSLKCTTHAGNTKRTARKQLAARPALRTIATNLACLSLSGRSSTF